MKEIILVDKPKGMSSFDVVRVMRKKLQGNDPRSPRPKIGHAGTLDPLASGLMILGVGKGTKRLGEFLKLPKRYEVEMILGESRTTGDMEGDVIERMPVSKLDPEKVKKVLRDMEGSLELSVPKYSAIKVEGERLYKKARRGEVFTAPKKIMQLDKLKLKKIQKEFDHFTLFITMDVGSGAYVRSIVEEVGRRLGYPAVTKELRRTKIGKYRLWFAKKI